MIRVSTNYGAYQVYDLAKLFSDDNTDKVHIVVVIIMDDSDTIENIQRYIFGKYPQAVHRLHINLGYDIGTFTGEVIINNTPGPDIGNKFKKYQHLKKVHIEDIVSDKSIDLGSYTHFDFAWIKIESSLDNIRYVKSNITRIVYNPYYAPIKTIRDMIMSSNLHLNQEQLDDILSKVGRILGKCEMFVKNDVVFRPEDMARLKINHLVIFSDDTFNVDSLMIGEYPKSISLYGCTAVSSSRYDLSKKICKHRFYDE